MATIEEVADGIYRVNTPVDPSVVEGGFSFNQYLIADEEPLLFHTGSRRLFESVAAAIGRVIELRELRYVAFSHHEQDEDGALNQFLSAAGSALPLCGAVNAMINADGMDRPPRVMQDGETLSLGRHVLRWLDAPHVPHGWEAGYLMEHTTQTLLCGDLFTQPGTGERSVTEADVLEPSEAFRKTGGDYFSHGAHLQRSLARMASLEPALLACMHGSAWRGDAKRLLQELARRLDERG